MGNGLNAPPCEGVAIEVSQVSPKICDTTTPLLMGGSGGAEVSVVENRVAQIRVAQPSASPLKILAIDIGRTGALALLTPVGELLAIEDMPCVADGPAYRPGINGALLAAIVRRWAPAEAVVEHVAARPGEAPSGAFSFGRSRGVVEGVLGSQAVPVRFVTPAWWKRRVGIPPGRDMKDTARAKALARWPARAEWFARAMDHDRAEAALLGLAHITDDKHGKAAA